MDKRELPQRKVVFVCGNVREPGKRVCCGAQGGQAFRDKLKALVKKRGLKGKIRVSQSGCMDVCEDGPNIMIFPDNVWYSNVAEDDLEPLIDALEEALRAEEAGVSGAE